MPKPLLEIDKKLMLNGWQFWLSPFKGLRTQGDAASNTFKGFFPNGLNMQVGDDGYLETRLGSEVVGADGSTPSTPGRNQWTFTKRDNTQIEMRVFGTRVEWRHPDDDDDVWNLLQSVTTSGLEFGHAECNLNSNATSRIYFCNGGTGANDDLWRWNGAIALINSTTADTITVYGSTSLANLGFSASGTIIINGTQYTYSGLSGQQFTGVSGDPTGEGI